MKFMIEAEGDTVLTWALMLPDVSLLMECLGVGYHELRRADICGAGVRASTGTPFASGTRGVYSFDLLYSNKWTYDFLAQSQNLIFDQGQQPSEAVFTKSPNMV